MRIALVLFSALLLGGCCESLLQGEVRTVDHQPVQGARISVDETGAVRYTDHNGRYAVALFCRPGQPYLIRVLASGYPEISDMIDSVGGHITKNWVVGEDAPAAPRQRFEREPEPEPEYQPEPEPEYRPEPTPPARQPTPPVRRDPPPPVRSPSRADKSNRTCPECETVVPQNSRNCPGCGAVYLGPNSRAPERVDPPRRETPPARSAEPKPEPSRAHRADTGKTCPECGTGVAKGDSSCAGCGADVY